LGCDFETEEASKNAEAPLSLILLGTQTEVHLISPFPSTTFTQKIHEQINEEKV
jgi:hypothetical protein